MVDDAAPTAAATGEKSIRRIDQKTVSGKPMSNR